MFFLNVFFRQTCTREEGIPSERTFYKKTIKHIFYSKQPAIFDDFCECDVAHEVLKLCDRLFNFTAKAAHSNATYSFNLSFENELQGILCVQLLVLLCII